MLRINQCKIKIGYSTDDLHKKVAEILKVKPQEIIKIEIRRESLDARKKPDLFYVLSLDVWVKEEERVLKKCKNKEVSKQEEKKYCFPKLIPNQLEKSPVIIGAGPAGLVCAYYLACAGFSPILLERGKKVDLRKEEVDKFWETGVLNPNSNVQFGEGGAGTFSDGKLNTLVKDKYGRCAQVLSLFAKMGAPKDIVYKQKPHVGTDLLIDMVKNLREAIIEAGGEVRFESCVTDFDIKNGRIVSVTVNEKEIINTNHVVLAIGHSARDTFELLYQKKLQMEPKAFAVGYRVMHPQDRINASQYGAVTPKTAQLLGPASYKLTYKARNERGVYSFCMCPGGYVVNASSQEGGLAINGMSYHKRDSQVANSAIIVSVTPNDFSDKTPLGGVKFQRDLEKKAYECANGKIPIQFLKEYKASVSAKENKDAVLAIKGAYAWSNLRGIMPQEVEEAFIEGMESFGRSIQGFDADDVVIAGVESRTSSPVKILRDDTGQASWRGLFPCGEGAGYAGGITSAAMDGLLIAEKVAYSMANEMTGAEEI